ncbi:PREDICTED: uncharacterized protein LOC105565668 isoform X2 [Vollenhovia emeryi]|uniref:uncharacterized protein LOC105565668 isoform X2 n=1 Tax=Vollenhovia emeryi TaxID=411798 RepID=UPI0005F3BC13|nr:PREDICTED: uncharacterized protein LOC105565668 isoform X2 [Vollenhovia emeryi]
MARRDDEETRKPTASTFPWKCRSRDAEAPTASSRGLASRSCHATLRYAYVNARVSVGPSSHSVRTVVRAVVVVVVVVGAVVSGPAEGRHNSQHVPPPSTTARSSSDASDQITH